ncbi:MAG: DEAD/DEAH box helicase family protein [Planctomycetes bacterium]|nr:DEAD/DEAH box helicase family protein [Planctomycetota bacterium]
MSTILYYKGGLVVRGSTTPRSALELPGATTGGAGELRLPAPAYRDLVVLLANRGERFEDRARAYAEVAWREVHPRRPFPHQTEALEAWWRAGGRGVVALPTGAGKSHVAILAMQRARRSALVVVPTLDLMEEWRARIEFAFGADVARLGGEERRLADLTVATYASAGRRAGEIGNRFGLVVFDECHHLPGEEFSRAARWSIAPYRLGLSATPERAGGGGGVYENLIGPIVYRREIDEMAGGILSDYEVATLAIELSPVERERYEARRGEYLDFVRGRGLSPGSPDGWKEFLRVASRSPAGRRAFRAFLDQKDLANSPSGKFDALERILSRHPRERVLVFSTDNATAYRVSRIFLVPALTHRTRPGERRELLASFAAGTLPVLVTSRVLNEGIDVPEASVAVVWSGTGSVREHVQRLGRILRRREGKRAVLYELVSRRTSEESVSARRRNHVAYARKGNRC